MEGDNDQVVPPVPVDGEEEVVAPAQEEEVVGETAADETVASEETV